MEAGGRISLALSGRGSKERVRIPRAIHFARDSEFRWWMVFFVLS